MINPVDASFGGLGSAVAEVLTESNNPNIFFKRLGLEDSFCYQAGSQKYLRKVKGLSIDEIIKTIHLNLSHTPGLAKEGNRR